ncbi:MAG: hypothetical protein OEU46_18310 [Alphaproteobacteria bacterium]|nr:hypothetical protein [Alphaproteobacteria bacterium]
MTTIRILILSLFVAALFAAGPAAPVSAASMKVSAVLAPKEKMRLNFEDGSKHFVLFVRREGAAEGSGPLAGAAVTEFGMHDITPGVSGDPRGYLVFTAPGGDKAYVKWLVRAIFVPNPGGKPKFKLLDYGHWEVVSGTGKFKGLKGVGTMTIKAASKTDRRFTLEGDLIPKS